MGKALLGTHVTPGSLRLLDEVRALRTRVAELERALAEAEATRGARTDEAGHEASREVATVESPADVDVVRVEQREPAHT